MVEGTGVGMMTKYEEPTMCITIVDLEDIVTLSIRDDIDTEKEQGGDGGWLS